MCMHNHGVCNKTNTNKRAYHATSTCAHVIIQNMTDDDHEPQVTGLSPKEGKEGTKIIIRGQNLGKDKYDLKSNAVLSSMYFNFTYRTNNLESYSYIKLGIVTPLLQATPSL